MLSKDSLREQFSKEPEKYYSTKLFKEQGFERRQCKICGKFFWTADPKRELCGDPSHEPYSFIKEKPVHISYVEFWKKFSGIFKKEGHEIIESYPVVSRWRQDLYFTIAGIQDFQRIENGVMSFEYPANPLLVPQMCLRFNDIPNTGVTGRHMTSFMMANQTAFNYPQEGYWRDRTIELNFKVLTELLGIDKKDITYIEDVWAMGDFSEFGPCLESFAHGLELVNSVFTQFSYSEGKIEELKGKVVDVGWGFERLLWYYSGTQTAYDAAFAEELSYIYKSMGIKPNEKLYSKVAGMLGTIDLTESEKNSNTESLIISKAGISSDDYFGVIKPMQAAYAIADHTRTLLFAITDGALPSNVGGGYNLRILLRRIFDFMDAYGNVDLMHVIEMHAKELLPIYPRLADSLGEISKIIDVERKRYEATKASASRIINSIMEKKEKLTPEKLSTLYESNGITPDMLERAAKVKGITIEMPENAYSRIIKGDFAEERKKEEKVHVDISGIKPTERLYYKGASESVSKVLSVQGNNVIIDATPFYPEGGGQEADHGSMGKYNVIDVQQVGNVVVHVLSEKPSFKPGDTVECRVDMERRLRLMVHHTATHLISAASRSILGRHAWQEGAKKSPDKAHIDIAHYERLTPEQIQAIEDKANSYILHGIRVKAEELDRNDAEQRFGFSIYQGHGVPSKLLRIVQITDMENSLIDAEACGGLHLQGLESTIGIIKIINSYRIHDGIDRLEYVAGPAMLDYINGVMAGIDRLAKLAGVDKDKLNKGIESKIKELDDYRKKYDQTIDRLSDYIASELAESSNSGVERTLDYDRSVLRLIATKYADMTGSMALLMNNSGEVVAISGGKANAKEAIERYAKEHGKRFKGGGSERIAEGMLA
ncbi:MAG: alanine--tRNA ligase [Candidatus Micrarchaeia archaeon]